jgi:ABC-type transport system involved in cytochrome bd biosynthesis fused ATPase/permease subunit
VNRPHLLSRFDEVVFMEHGRIIDVGTASDLKELQPAFLSSLEKASSAVQERAVLNMAEEGGLK